MTTKDKLKELIASSDEEVVFDIAKNFLNVEQIEKLLLKLDTDTQKEILSNFL
ncbi:MAG: hypothetical protein M0D57_04545 [Sphingobacteriales bacterium JAD_PAG50586_3]|nr:MAG: hypothetical protein M0D57_04545 [Sphingobacteriales bacterium JAD_PAG50586_3]